jgi:heavy-metal resistance protein CzcE
MKLVITSLFAATLSAASLSAAAATRADLLGEPAQAPSAQRAVVSAAYGRTIAITGDTKWVNVNHGEVVRFVADGREFTWYFDGVSQPRPFDLSEIAPEGFVDHGVKVYVGLGDDANLG